MMHYSLFFALLFVYCAKINANERNTVVKTENDLDEAKLKEIIDKTGYKLLSVSKAPYEKKKGFFSFLKK